MKVGFIGLGGMGKHLAINIVEAGFEVTVNDLREQPVQELVQYGARAAGSAREVAAASDIVLVSLASNQASKEVALGPDGALAGAKSGDILHRHKHHQPEGHTRDRDAGGPSGTSRCWTRR